MENRSEIIMENELYHHGVLGMRWGARRSKSSGSGSSGTSNKRKLSSDAKSASTLKKKKSWRNE